MKKQLLLAIGVVGAVSCSPLTDLHADIRLAISVPGGPRFYFESRPDFIYLDDYGFSVSWGGPYDVIYYGNAYFVFQDGYWYRAYDYRGPWGRIGDYDLPSAIRRHQWNDIRRRRDFEYRRHDRNFWEDRFRRDREHWQGPDDRRGFDDRRRPDDRRGFDDRRGPDDRRGFDDRRGPDDRRNFDDRRDDDRRRPEERRGPSTPQPNAGQPGPRGGQMPSATPFGGTESYPAQRGVRGGQFPVPQPESAGIPQAAPAPGGSRGGQSPAMQPAPVSRQQPSNQQQGPSRPQEQRRRDDQDRRDNRDNRQGQGDRDNRDDRFDRR